MRQPARLDHGRRELGHDAVVNAFAQAGRQIGGEALRIVQKTLNSAARLQRFGREQELQVAEVGVRKHRGLQLDIGFRPPASPDADLGRERRRRSF
jgi:hypothetical protein